MDYMDTTDMSTMNSFYTLAEVIFLTKGLLLLVGDYAAFLFTIFTKQEHLSSEI